MAFNNSITNCEIFYNGILKSVNIFSSSSSSSLTNKSSSNSNSKNNGPSNNELMAMMMNKKGNENVDNHHLKRASKSTLFNEHLFFLQAKSSNNNKKSSAIVNYNNNKNNNKLKSAPFKPHFSWLDLIYVGQYKNVHYSQYRYNALFDRFVYLEKLFDVGFSFRSRRSSSDLNSDAYYYITSAQLDDSNKANKNTMLIEDKSSPSSPSSSSSYLSKVKSSYQKLIESLNRCFAAPGENELQSESTMMIKETDDDSDQGKNNNENKRNSIKTNSQQLAIEHDFHDVNYCSANDSPHRCNRKNENNNKNAKSNSNNNHNNLIENFESILAATKSSSTSTTHNDMITILVIMVITSAVSILFATIVFIKFNK